MTTDLEKQFFDTFGIEPITGIGLVKFKEPSYPTITDRILLELICIINQSDAYLHGEEYCFEAVNYKDLKEEVISKCKRLAHKNAFSEVTGGNIKRQVRTLFEEG